jgi:hypothetical protein
MLANKHTPWLPMASALFAMGVYGLTVPGSPLQAAVSMTAFAATSVSLAVAGAVVITVLTPFLGRGNRANVPS